MDKSILPTRSANRLADIDALMQECPQSWTLFFALLIFSTLLGPVVTQLTLGLDLPGLKHTTAPLTGRNALSPWLLGFLRACALTVRPAELLDSWRGFIVGQVMHALDVLDFFLAVGGVAILWVGRKVRPMLAFF